MKILHSESSTGWGGQEIRILSEMACLQKRRHQMSLACQSKTPIHIQSVKQGYPTYTLPIGKISPLSLYRCWQLINKIKPDLVSCHSSKDHWNFAITRFLFRKKYAIVRTRHISLPVKSKLSNKWLYQHGCDAIMTTGNYIKSMLTLIAPESKIFSVPTGVDISRYQPTNNKNSLKIKWNLPTDKTIFSIVGTLRSWKGHDFLIEAFKQIKSENALLLIIGDGPRREHLFQHQSEKIKFLGQLSDPLEIFQLTDCLVSASYANEGIPQVLLQGMAIGTPIISTNIGGCAEALAGYKAAKIIPPKDVTALKDELDSFLTHPRLASKPHTPHTLETMSDLTESIYIDAIKKHV